MPLKATGVGVHGALKANDVTRACDVWLEVWDGFKLHLGPAVGRVRDVDTLFAGTEFGSGTEIVMPVGPTECERMAGLWLANQQNEWARQ